MKKSYGRNLIAIAAIISIVILGNFYSSFFFWNRSVVIVDSQQDLGKLPAGKNYEISFNVLNFSNRSVEILGNEFS